MSEMAVPVPEKGEIFRITGVFFEPTAAFADIAARPRWWAPMILLIILQIVFLASFTQHVGWSRFMRQQMESNERIQQMPAEQRDKIIDMQVKFAAPMGFVGGIVGLFVVTLTIAAIFKGLFAVTSSGFTFKQGFAIACYSWLPNGIAALLATIVVWIKDPSDFDLRNPLAFNLGAFLDPSSTAKGFHSLASSIDLFSIWVVLLLALGYSVASKKLSFGKSLAAVGGVWLLFIFGKAAWAGIFG